MADLKTNYVDDILDTSINTQRRYNKINNADGTVSLEDVTVYSQSGDNFGAADINKTNEEVNQLNRNFNTLGGFTPVIDETTGKITGYTTKIGGADTVFPFSSGIKGYGNVAVRTFMVLDVTNFTTLKLTIVLANNTNGLNVYANDTFDMGQVLGSNGMSPQYGNYTLLDTPKTVNTVFEYDISNVNYIDIMLNVYASADIKFLYELS